MSGARLRRLDLTRYGHFEGLQLDFGPARDCDITVIYGANEAGKSTAFAAWLDLLFGLPAGEHPYVFRFERKELEIGALLEDGERQMAVRRTGRGLLDGQNQPLEEMRLAPFRAGLDRHAFASRFSLNDASMRKGGQDIASGKGDLGEALHIGASGRAGLGAALTQLEARATAFHKKRGRTTVLKRAKDEIKALEAQIAAAELAPEGWDRLRTACDAARDRVEAAKDALTEARKKADLYRRATELRALDQRIQELEADLADAPVGPALPEGVEARHATLQANLAHASEARDQALADMTAAQEALAGLAVNTPPDVPLDWAEAAQTLLDAAWGTAEKHRDAWVRAEDLAKSIPEGPEAEIDLSALEAALAILPDPARLEEAQSTVAQAERALAEAALGLPPDWPELVAQGLPEMAEVRTTCTALTDAERELARAASAVDEAQSELQARLRAVKAAEALPDQVSVENRDAARRARDAAWDAHRRALDAQSADAFAEAMRRDDAIQQRFTAGETARGRLALAREAVSGAEDDLEKSKSLQDTSLRSEGHSRQAFESVTQQLGLPPNAPTEALSQRLERLISAAKASIALDAAKEALETLEGAQSRAVSALTALLGPDGDVTARAKAELKQGTRHNALWEARKRAQAHHNELLAQADEVLTEAKRQEEALRVHLKGSPLVQRSLSDLREIVPILQALLRACAARGQTEADMASAKAGLAALFEGQGRPDLPALLARDQTRLALKDAQDRRSDLVGPDEDALAQAAQDTDPARAAMLETEVTAAETALTEALQAYGAAQRDLDAVWQQDSADAPRQALAARLQRLRQEARTALAAQLAHMIGRRALQQHEAATRGALLDATQTAFARLTGGAWPRLETDSDGKGGQLLYAVDGAGRTRIDRLSTGTQGQIYLALRLAGYELFAQEQGALPFVLDDVAETFDDTRARAALTMLGELGARGQAIFLTHHRHLVDMACETLPDVRVIDLPTRAGA